MAVNVVTIGVVFRGDSRLGAAKVSEEADAAEGGMGRKDSGTQLGRVAKLKDILLSGDGVITH